MHFLRSVTSPLLPIRYSRRYLTFPYLFRHAYVAIRECIMSLLAPTVELLSSKERVGARDYDFSFSILSEDVARKLRACIRRTF